jgi:hypothetical protein
MHSAYALGGIELVLEAGQVQGFAFANLGLELQIITTTSMTSEGN